MSDPFRSPKLVRPLNVIDRGIYLFMYSFIYLFIYSLFIHEYINTKYRHGYTIIIMLHH